MPTPHSLCACPVGVLNDCAHRGGALLLIYAIRQCFQGIGYDDLMQWLPTNIHAIAGQLYLASHMYPPPYTKDYRVEESIKKKAAAVNADTLLENETDSYIQLEETNDEERAGMKTVPLINLCDEVTQWCNEIKVAAQQRDGAGHKYDVNRAQEACVAAATPNNDPGYRIRKHFRMVNEALSVREGKSPATLCGYIAEDHLSGLCEAERTYTDMQDHYLDPYTQIYPDDGSEAMVDDSDHDEYNYNGRYHYHDEESDDDDDDYSSSSSESK